MTTEEWFDKATAYFNGTMSIEDSRLFEEQTAASGELSDLMQLWKQIDAEAPVYEQFGNDATSFIETHRRIKAAFTDKVITTAPDKKMRIWKWVAVAATVGGIIIVMKFFSTTSVTHSPVVEHIEPPRKNVAPKNLTKRVDGENLFAQNFSPDNVPEDPNGALDDAFFYYASRQYKKAIVAIDSSEKKPLTRGTGAGGKLTAFYAVYYKGLSLLSLNDADDAVPLLNEAVNVAPSIYFKTKAQWYLALGYLKQGNLKSARETLALVINSRSAHYHSRATSLLAELNK